MACHGNEFVADSHGLGNLGKDSRQPLVEECPLQQEMFVRLAARHLKKARDGALALLAFALEQEVGGPPFDVDGDILHGLFGLGGGESLDGSPGGFQLGVGLRACRFQSLIGLFACPDDDLVRSLLGAASRFGELVVRLLPLGVQAAVGLVALRRWRLVLRRHSSPSITLRICSMRSSPVGSAVAGGLASP